MQFPDCFFTTEKQQQDITKYSCLVYDVYSSSTCTQFFNDLGRLLTEVVPTHTASLSLHIIPECLEIRAMWGPYHLLQEPLMFLQLKVFLYNSECMFELDAMQQNKFEIVRWWIIKARVICTTVKFPLY